jgi:hypothetical protein
MNSSYTKLLCLVSNILSFLSKNLAILITYL